MEGSEEFVGSIDQAHVVVRGKRTKRQRISPSHGGSALTSSSSSGVGSGGESGGGGVVEDFASTSSPATSEEIHTEEEEDMANCLILLAQGDGPRRMDHSGSVKIARVPSRRLMDTDVIGKSGGTGVFVYECKTCNRTFPSFQALGGHRASHKKPKPTSPTAMGDERKVPGFTSMDEPEELPQLNNNSRPIQIPIQIPHKGMPNNKANKVHECSICGLEFASGQALGGHMRRHRAAQVATGVDSPESETKQRNVLALDLNLPAPEEDSGREAKFGQFTTAQQSLVFSAPALVDCHY